MQDDTHHSCSGLGSLVSKCKPVNQSQLDADHWQNLFLYKQSAVLTTLYNSSWPGKSGCLRLVKTLRHQAPRVVPVIHGSDQ